MTNKIIAFLTQALLFIGCSSMNYETTVTNVNIDQFMGKWYVIAGRFTFLEAGAHNAIENYKWNEEKERVDVSFTFNKDSFEGTLNQIPQKAWIHNKETNAHWKIRPIWPIKLDYLIIAIADDYSWSAVGVPSGKYLWIMARDWDFSKDKTNEVLSKLKNLGYPTDKIVFVPQKW